MVTTIDKVFLARFRSEVDAALKVIADRHGITASLGRGKYTASNAEFKLNLAVKGESGEFETAERAAFKAFASSYGLQPADLGKVFVCAGRQYKISGLKTKSYARPILAVGTHDNRTYKFPAITVSNLMRAAV